MMIGMIQDKILSPEGVRLYNRHTMRWAKSYSIIDHEILHGGYLHRLSHPSMILYLFLVVVGDRDGRSFYADRTIMEILRLSAKELNDARLQLLEEGLIDYQRPYWWVKNISPREKRKDMGGYQEVNVSSDRRVDKTLAQRSIKRTVEQILHRAKQQGSVE